MSVGLIYIIIALVCGAMFGACLGVVLAGLIAAGRDPLEDYYRGMP